MDYAISETSCNSVLNFDDVIEKDRKRYVRKGYGLFFAFLIFSLYFLLSPIIMRGIIQQFSWMTATQLYCATLIPAHNITYIFGNAYMWVIYSLKLPFFERYKIDSRQWPWDKDPQKWKIKSKQVFHNWLLNSSIGSLMCVVDSLLVTEWRIDLDSFPTHFEILWQIAFSMCMEDFVFYWSHRTLHHPKIYARIHKKHHEFFNTVSFAAEYAHPLEYAIGNVLPSFVAAKLLGNRMHIATLNIWLIMRVFETIDGHCGYEFSWSPYRLLPFSGSSEYHNFHHSHNVGNYSSFFYYLDTLCGTNRDFYIYRAKVEKEVQLQRLRNDFEKKKIN